MVQCPTCGSENSPFVSICVSCKSFLRAKVENLDLFATLWLMVESPRTAFLRIVSSKHKNYAVLLSAFFGIAVTYEFFWLMRWGNSSSNLFSLLAGGLVAGPLVGILLLGATAFFLRQIKPKSTWKDTYAVVAYAGVPMVFSLVFIFPVEIAVFGLFFFGSNPPPSVLDPVPYYTLRTISALTGFWAILLLGLAISVIKEIPIRRGVSYSLIMFAGIAGSLVAIKSL